MRAERNVRTWTDLKNAIMGAVISLYVKDHQGHQTLREAGRLIGRSRIEEKSLTKVRLYRKSNLPGEDIAESTYILKDSIGEKEFEDGEYYSQRFFNPREYNNKERAFDCLEE